VFGVFWAFEGLVFLCLEVLGCLGVLRCLGCLGLTVKGLG